MTSIDHQAVGQLLVPSASTMHTSSPAAGPSGSASTPATPPSPATPLQRDFPAAAQLRREDLEDLLCDATDPREREEQHAYFEAFFDSLPEVRALYDQHARLLQRNEQAAGTSSRPPTDRRTDPPARNLALRPELEALRADTRSTFERARALETEWGVAAGEMQEAYKVCGVARAAAADRSALPPMRSSRACG